MPERGHGHRLRREWIDELRLAASELSIRMQLTEEELPARTQHARRLAIHGGELAHVLEHEIAHHHVRRRALHRPRPCDVVLHEADVRRAHAPPRHVEHPRREVQRDDLACAAGEPLGILSRAASQLDHPRPRDAERRSPKNLRVEVTRRVVIEIVLARPAVVCIRDVRRRQRRTRK
jgi:hypothetical protein